MTSDDYTFLGEWAGFYSVSEPYITEIRNMIKERDKLNQLENKLK